MDILTLAVTASLAVDTMHYQGKPAVFVNAGPVIVSSIGYGADQRLYKNGRFSIDSGVFYLYNTDRGMGGHINFITTFRYKKVVFRHISHTLIEPGTDNLGYNFLGLEYQIK